MKIYKVVLVAICVYMAISLEASERVPARRTKRRSAEKLYAPKVEKLGPKIIGSGPVEDSHFFHNISKNEKGYRVVYEKNTGKIGAFNNQYQFIPLTKDQIKKFISDVKNAGVRFTSEQSMIWESLEKKYSK